MSRDERLGDRMPDRKNVKWGEMKAGESHLSDEWHDMEPSSVRMSEKWVEMHESKGQMSEKWVDMENPTNVMGGAQWDVMKQEGREDPYSMHPSSGDRTVGMKPMAKQKPDVKVERATQHNEFGSTREI